MSTNEPEIYQQQGKRILIVDDSEDMACTSRADP